MFKIKLRNFIKELFCLHKNTVTKTRDIGLQSFNTIECLDCGKVMVKKIWIKNIFYMELGGMENGILCRNRKKYDKF